MEKKGMIPVTLAIITVIAAVLLYFGAKAIIANGITDTLTDPEEETDLYADCYARYGYDIEKHSFEHCENARKDYVSKGFPVCDAPCKLSDNGRAWNIYYLNKK